MPYVPTPLQAPKKIQSITVRVYKKKKHTLDKWCKLDNPTQDFATHLGQTLQHIQSKRTQRLRTSEKADWQGFTNKAQTMASSSCFSSPGKSFSQDSWADSSRRFTEFQHPIQSRLRPFRLYKQVALYLALLLYLCQPHQTRIAESGGWEVWWKCILCQLASTVFHCIAEEGFPHFPNAKPASFQDSGQKITLLLGAPNPWNWHICWFVL